MLPRVDLIRAEENSWLLLNNQDHITDYIRKNGFWGHTESTIAKVFLANRMNTLSPQPVRSTNDLETAMLKKLHIIGASLICINLHDFNILCNS